MVIGINCGHTVSGTPGCGAVGYIDESVETRNVGYLLMDMLREYGYVVVDCTDDRSPTENDNLRKICTIANSYTLDMFISIHFNAGGGKGTEVYTAGAKDTAKAGAILNELIDLGFAKRGIKDGSNLYVLKHTKVPAALIEVCFVDSPSDTVLYKSIGSERVARAIYKAITGETYNKGDDLTMTQYEELTKLINGLGEEIQKLQNPVIYNYVDDNMPDWARPTIKKLADKGVLKGNADGLGLTEDLMRILVINDRMGLYD